MIDINFLHNEIFFPPMLTQFLLDLTQRFAEK